jgi:hypothetical protein
MKRGAGWITITATLLLASCSKGAFSLTNTTSETITRVSVTVCGQTREFREIQPGHSAPGCFTVRRDSRYEIEVEFQSGRKLSKGVGYVTPGLSTSDELIITDSDVQLVVVK